MKVAYLSCSIAIVVVMLAAAFSTLSAPTPGSLVDAPQEARVCSYTSHAPIYINGNSGFLGSNSSTGISTGSGTISDPYIIENWAINVTSATVHGIDIRNTDKFFVVRNVFVRITLSNPYYYGINLFGVDNGKLLNNVCKDCERGISLQSTTNTIVSYNSCSNNTAGIYVIYSTGDILSNNTCIDNPGAGPFSGGIAIVNSSNIELNGNKCSNNEMGDIYLQDSTDILLKNNKVLNGGISVWGEYLSEWNTHSIDTSNTVNNNPVYYYKNQTGLTVPTGSGQVILANCSNSIVRDLSIENTDVAILIGFSSKIFIDENSISNNEWSGVYLFSSNNNTICNNTFFNNFEGIDLFWSDDNLASDNVCSNSSYGMFLYGSSKNVLSDNICSNNEYDGLTTDTSDRNVIIDNIFSYNYRNGVLVTYSSSYNNLSTNCFYSNAQQGVNISSSANNNLISNNAFYFNNGAGDAYDPAQIQSCDGGANNIWNGSDGYGNWWNDWTTPDHVTPFGIVDLPYNISGSAGAKDYGPLTTPPPMGNFGPDPMVTAGDIALYVNTNQELTATDNNTSYATELRVVVTVTNGGLIGVDDVSVSLDINGTGTTFGDNEVGGDVKFVNLTGTGPSGSSAMVEWNYTVILKWAGTYRINITVDKENTILNDKNRSNNNAWRTFNLTYITPVIRLFTGAPHANVTAGETITVTGDVRYPVTGLPMPGTSVTVQMQNYSGVVICEGTSVTSSGGIFSIQLLIPGETPVGQYKIVIIVGQTHYEQIINVANHDVFGPLFILVMIVVIAIVSALIAWILLARKKQSVNQFPSNETNLENQHQLDDPWDTEVKKKL
jgi:parallel beta-helix repeat protein